MSQKARGKARIKIHDKQEIPDSNVPPPSIYPDSRYHDMLRKYYNTYWKDTSDDFARQYKVNLWQLNRWLQGYPTNIKISRAVERYIDEIPLPEPMFYVRKPIFYHG